MSAAPAPLATVGFIGLGMMGFPMAHLLHQAGHRLIVRDVAAATVERFLAEHAGAQAADDAAGFAPADVVITMLPNSDIVDATVLGSGGEPGLLGSLRPGAVVIDMSSSQPMRSKALAEKLSAAGLRFLDAPVSGGVRRAVDGTLAIMVGGDAELFEVQRDLLSRLGKIVTHVGPAGAGHAVKALNNYVSAAGLVAAAEALHVARRFGLDPAVVTDVFNGSTGKNNTTENKVKPFMLSGTFNSGFSLQLMAKDLGIAMSLGQTLDQPMQLGRTVLALWDEAARNLDRGADHTEMYRFLDKPAD